MNKQKMAIKNEPKPVINRPSQLLLDHENDIIFSLLGRKCSVNFLLINN